MINDCEIFPNFRLKLYWEAWCVVPLLGWAERRNKSARLSFNLQTAGQQRGICKSVVNLHELFCLQFGGVQQTGDHWWLLWRPSNMSPAIMNTTRCLQSDTCCRMGSQVHCTAQCATFSFDINSLMLSPFATRLHKEMTYVWMLCINDTVKHIDVKIEDHYRSAITFSDHTAARMVDVDSE